MTSPRSTLLPGTIKICLAIALAGFGATQYLSRIVEAPRRGAFIREVPGTADPETTGSLAGTAARTVLDPCAVGLRR